MSNANDIVADIRRVAAKIGRTKGEVPTVSEYLTNGAEFSRNAIYDDGRTWGDLLKRAGFRLDSTRDPVSNEVYFNRLKAAYEKLGRPPKTRERKQFKLNFSKSKWPNWSSFIEDSMSRGVIPRPQHQMPTKTSSSPPKFSAERDPKPRGEKRNRKVAPIPKGSRRKKWARTDVDAFPYAPHDESGVIALFAILCEQGKIPWQITSLNGGRGIDATCYDENEDRGLRVELKHTLKSSDFNHDTEKIDYVVCWENRWPDCPKPVIALADSVID